MDKFTSYEGFLHGSDWTDQVDRDTELTFGGGVQGDWDVCQIDSMIPQVEVVDTPSKC